MLNKKLAIVISIGALLAIVAGYMLISEEDEEEVQTPAVVEERKPEPIKQVKNDMVQPTMKSFKKAELYNSIDKNLPLSAISTLADLSNSAKVSVNALLNDSLNGIYFLTREDDKILAIVDLNLNEEESAIKRHNFNFMEISAKDGHFINYRADVHEEESKYDKWEYQNELPLSHKHYNNQNELEYSETWNYSEDEPIKYKKTDKNEQVVSLRKEVVDNGVNLREEHIFYDSDGNMTKNVSFNYNGLDLTRFTYYDSNSSDSSAMIVSEFEDGVKKKETVYSSDYKIKNIYIPEYKDGQKSEIKVYDKDNNLVETLQSF